MSDVDDEDLEALRAAALASIKSRTPKSSLTSSTEINRIAPINTVVASTSNYLAYPGSYNATEQSGYPNQYSWRTQVQAIRRNRGSGGNRSFPKVSQRSNLIVITPVSTEDKNSEEKGATSQLVLPQHKWCQSANEDSSSPKAYRRTGPTRFNRLESGTDSSDSDYDNTDNDSYSNETILQDEPSDHFAGRSGESIGQESSPEKPVSERRLSFQNIDSDLNLESFQNSESTSVYKCLNATYPNKSSEERPALLRSPSVENDLEHSWKHDSHKSYTYRQYDKAIVASMHSEQEHCSTHSVKTRTVNGGSPKKHKLLVLSSEADSSRSSRRPAEALQDNGSHNDLNSKTSHSNNDQTKLPENDLRLELKKRMYEFQSVSESSRKKSGSPDSQSPGRSRSRDRSYLRSSRSRDRSEGKNHIHGSSSSQKINRSCSRSQSPRRDCSRRWSRSPKKHRRHSSDRHRRRDRSQSLVRDRKRNRSHSTQRNHKRVRKSSPDLKRNRSRSKDRKPNRSSRYHRGRSRSSSSSSSSTSTSNSSSGVPSRSVSSIIKSVQPKDVGVKNEKGSTSRVQRTSSSESDLHFSPKKSKKNDENNSGTSNAKSSVYGRENKSIASDGNKRVPVHMRLGSLPGKRVIQMTKDVEAAFVNTSSDDADEEVNVKHRKDNFRVMYDINDSKSNESSKRHIQRNSSRSTDASKDRRLKHRR